MSKIKLGYKVLLTMFMLIGSGSASAGLLGTSVLGQYYFPDPLSLYDDAGIVSIGAGSEFFFVSALDVDITDTQVIINDTYFGNAYASGAFNGVRLTNTAFLGASLLSTNIVGFDSSRVTLVGGQLDINFQGASMAGIYGQVVIDIATTPVPEPSQLILLALGLAGIRFSRLRKS